MAVKGTAKSSKTAFKSGMYAVKSIPKDASTYSDEKRKRAGSKPKIIK